MTSGDDPYACPRIGLAGRQLRIGPLRGGRPRRALGDLQQRPQVSVRIGLKRSGLHGHLAQRGRERLAELGGPLRDRPAGTASLAAARADLVSLVEASPLYQTSS